VTIGLDSPQSKVQGWNVSPTGYWTYKFMNESNDFTKSNSNVPLIVIRLPEIYLNYAEAEWHLGNYDLARKYANKVRTRVQLPPLTSSGNQLLKDIKHERRVELNFDDVGIIRWNDIRRWKILDKVDKDAKGVFVYKHDDGSLTYKYKVAQKRTYDPKLYSLPIPYDEIKKSNLTQNPGY
jgi:hypothetical protein